MKTGPKLNLIKKIWGKRGGGGGGGGGNPTSLTSDKKQFWGRGREGGTETKTTDCVK